MCGRLGRARCVLWVSLETRERANTEVPALRATQVMRSWAQRATCAGLAGADPVSPPALPLSHLGERGVLPGPRVGRHTPTDAIDPIHYTIGNAPRRPPPRPPLRARRTAGIAAEAPMTGTAARRAVPQSCPRQCPRSYSRPHSAWSSFPLLRRRLQAARRHVRPPLLAAASPAARPRRGPESGTPACPRRPRPGCARRCGAWSARRGGAP